MFLTGIAVGATCCIFKPAFGCFAPQTLVEIVIFSVFVLKSFKKTLMDGWMDGWTFDGQTDKQMDGWMDGWNFD